MAFETMTPEPKRCSRQRGSRAGALPGSPPEPSGRTLQRHTDSIREKATGACGANALARRNFRGPAAQLAGRQFAGLARTQRHLNGPISPPAARPVPRPRQDARGRRPAAHSCRADGLESALSPEVVHLLVGGRREVVVPLTDGAEVGGHERAHDLVGQGGEIAARVGRPDRHGDYHARRVMRAHGADRGPHRRARREPVVHEHHDAIAQLRKRTPLPVAPFLPDRARAALLVARRRDPASVTPYHATASALTPRHTPEAIAPMPAPARPGRRACGPGTRQWCAKARNLERHGTPPRGSARIRRRGGLQVREASRQPGPGFPTIRVDLIQFDPATRRARSVGGGYPVSRFFRQRFPSQPHHPVARSRRSSIARRHRASAGPR